MRRIITWMILAVLLVSCASEPATQGVPKSADPGEPVITVSRSGGLAGHLDEWKIYADGKVTTSGGSTVSSLSSGQVESLIKDIQSLGFFGMNDSYGENSSCRDCYNYTVRVSNQGQVKTVTAVEGAGDAPANLWNMVDKILVAAGEASK